MALGHAPLDRVGEQQAERSIRADEHDANEQHDAIESVVRRQRSADYAVAGRESERNDECRVVVVRGNTSTRARDNDIAGHKIKKKENVSIVS